MPTSLTQLQAEYCRITGSIPSILLTLTNLKILNLDENSLNVAFDGAFHLPNSLVDLYLIDCNIGGSFPFALTSLTNLERLYLGVNFIVGTIPDFISTMTTTLRLFALDDCGIVGTFPFSLGIKTSFIGSQ